MTREEKYDKALRSLLVAQDLVEEAQKLGKKVFSKEYPRANQEYESLCEKVKKDIQKLVDNLES